MTGFLPVLAAILVAYSPFPQEVAVRVDLDLGNASTGAQATWSRDKASAIDDPDLAGSGASGQRRAASGPGPEPISAAQNPARALLAESAAEARGRQILSTAFVRTGPEGHLSVTLGNGRVLMLRNVVMRRKDYCGLRVNGDKAGTHYCGRYADVAAARPGHVSTPAEPDLAVSNPIQPSLVKNN